MAAGTGRKSAAGEDSRVIRTRADVGRTALDVLVTEGSDALTHASIVDASRLSRARVAVTAHRDIAAVADVLLPGSALTSPSADAHRCAPAAEPPW